MNFKDVLLFKTVKAEQLDSDYFSFKDIPLCLYNTIKNCLDIRIPPQVVEGYAYPEGLENNEAIFMLQSALFFLKKAMDGLKGLEGLDEVYLNYLYCGANLVNFEAYIDRDSLYPLLEEIGEQLTAAKQLLFILQTNN